MNLKNLNITATPSAITHIKKVLSRHPGSLGFRLTMRKYGCNGYGYVPEVVESVSKEDFELIVSPEIRFFIDKNFIEQLKNTEIDFIVKNLGQEQLIFRNPNVEGECGCGESVNFKEKE